MHISQILPSQFEAIPPFSALLLVNIHKEFDLTKNEDFDIKIVLEEALTNAIKHGNQFDPNRCVWVEVSINGRQLTINVKDEGGGFDTNSIANPTDEDRLMKTSVRGVFLIKKLMDEVRFEDQGRKIIMIKKLTNHRRVLWIDGS